MEKQRYRVAAGVELVAGQPVPKNRIVELTAAEALYEEALGRVAPATAKEEPKADGGA